MIITKKKLEKILEDHSDLKTYFMTKSQSPNWILDAVIEVNDELQKHGSNKLVTNIMKTSIEPAALGALFGALGGMCGTIVLFATDNPIFVLVGIGTGIAAGIVTGGISEKKQPEVDDWKPVQTATINTLKQRARNFKHQ